MIKIIADSTCDLNDEIISKYDISIAPLRLFIDEKEYKDKIDITADEFYARIEDFEKHPTTAMPPPSDYLDLFNEAINDHDEILCICMSSGTSGAYQSAVIAKEYFYEEHPDSKVKIEVVDSLSMSHGSGYLVLKSAKLRELGATYDELVEFNNTYRTNIKHFLSVDDLDHLIRSGRLSNASAVIGKILNLKPIMSMKKGKGSIVSKQRGRKKVLNHYIREFQMRVDETINDFVIMGYTSDILYAENLKNKLLSETDFKGEIYIMQMGPVVGNHVGLGGLSFYFIEKDKIKDGLMMSKYHEMLEAKNKFVESMKKYK